MKVWVNNILADLFDKTIIAPTFQIQDIADVESFKSTFTNTFSFPLTRNNRQIFNAPDDITNVSDLPYKKLSMKIDNGDFNLDGIFVINSVTQNNVSGNFYEGISVLKNILQGKKLKDLDLSDLDHVWSATDAYNSRTNTEGYIWAAIDTGGLSGNDYDVAQSIPSVYVKTIFERMLQGVNYDNELQSNTMFNKLVIPCTLLSPKNKYIGTETETFVYPQFASVGLEINALSDDGFEELSLSGMRIVIQELFTGSTRIELTVNDTTITATGGVNLPLIETFNDTGLLSVVNGRVVGWDGIKVWEITFDLVAFNNKNVPIGFSFELGQLGSIVFFHEITLSKLEIGELIDVARSLPDMTQIDFIKGILNMFGMVCDQKNNRFIFRYFDNLLKFTVKDWSEYVVKESETISYKLGYGQTNNFKYLEDDELADGDFQLNINDENLEPEKDMVKLPFAATREGIFIPEIDLFESGEIKGKPKARILFVEFQLLASFDYYEDNVLVQSTTNQVIPIAYFDKAGTENLKWSSLIRYWKVFQKVINATKIVNCQMILPASELTEFDFLQGKYIKYLGNNFYVNKISNYISGKPVNIELIKI